MAGQLLRPGVEFLMPTIDHLDGFDWLIVLFEVNPAFCWGLAGVGFLWFCLGILHLLFLVSTLNDFAWSLLFPLWCYVVGQSPVFSSDLDLVVGFSLS